MADDEMPDHATVIRVSHIQPLPGKQNDLVARVMPAVDTMRTVEGCFGVQVCTIKETPGVIAVVSRWADQAALDQVESAGTFNDNIISDLVAATPTVEHLMPFAGGPGPD
jgi:quinol monooxygenase YgiN